VLEGVVSSLSDLQINHVVEQYLKEMARYEGAARHVEQRLRRELREAAIPTLLSSRAKHPEDLREKLRRKRADSRYQLDALLKNLNHVVTDVAGCRVVVYDPRQASIAADVVRRSFAPWRGSDRSDEVLDKSSGYKATHILVALDKDVDLALFGAVCEVQVTSIACHAFNELEHGIAYKLRGVAPGMDVQRYTKDAFYAARLLDAMVERLTDGRAREIADSARTIDNSEDLRFVLERIIDRPIGGEVERLRRLLRGVLEPITARALEGVVAPTLVADGMKIAASCGITDADEVIAIALGLVDRFGPEFRDLAAQWRGPSTPLKRAILKATEP
jgi:ppGpp synthetase/RelA/SpoT-type nucleotidyltranferase